jgi:hypothetical protein
MVNPNGTPQSLGVTPLAEGEYSRPVRVRAPAWVFVALAQRGAIEVGNLLQVALRATNDPVPPLEPVTLPPHTPSNALRDPPIASAPTAAPGLSRTLLGIVDSLKAGAVAEYDHRERRWMVNDRHGPYPVYKRHLQQLVKAGLIREEQNRYRAQ